MPYHQPVKQVMKQQRILDIRETDSVAKAIQMLDQCDISALPVRGPEEKYTGVISKSDIASMRFLKSLKARVAPEAIAVREIMNRTPPVYVMQDNPVREAIALMHRRHIHRLFVADADYQLIGVISTSDILRLLFLSQ